MLISSAQAQTTTPTAPVDGGTAALVQFAPFLLLIVAFYFLLIRPQQKRMKDQQNAIAAVKKGDEVTTAGGVIGKVTRVEDAVVEVEIAQGVKVRVVKSTLVGITPLSGKPAND